MFDYFNKEKSDFLRKKDKSRKGYMDKDAVKIVDEINSKSDFYTTSSCSGRIVLLEMKSRKKNECNWIFSKHSKTTFNEIINSLENRRVSGHQKCKAFFSALKNKSKIKHEIWFKQQPIILHVACRDFYSAKNLLDATRKVFKHSGIIGITDKKVTIEIMGSERIETIIADKNFVADKNYIKELIKHANENFVENKRKSEKFLKIIERI